MMNKKEIELIVNILNHQVEELGLSVDEDGFGYILQTLEIDSVSDDSLEECLQLVWNLIMDNHKKKSDKENFHQEAVTYAEEYNYDSDTFNVREAVIDAFEAGCDKALENII